MKTLSEEMIAEIEASASLMRALQGHQWVVRDVHVHVVYPEPPATPYVVVQTPGTAGASLDRDAVSQLRAVLEKAIDDIGQWTGREAYLRGNKPLLEQIARLYRGLKLEGLKLEDEP